MARSAGLRDRAGADRSKRESGQAAGDAGGGPKRGTLPIEGSAGHPQGIAGGHHTHLGGQMSDGVHQGVSSGSAFGRGHPNSLDVAR